MGRFFHVGYLLLGFMLLVPDSFSRLYGEMSVEKFMKNVLTKELCIDTDFMEVHLLFLFSFVLLIK